MVVPRMRFIVLCFLCLAICLKGFAQQQDTSAKRTYARPQADTNKAGTAYFMDSIAAAIVAKQQREADSLAMQYIRQPDSTRVNQFAQIILNSVLYKGYGFLDVKVKAQSVVREGSSRVKREQWIIGVIIILLLYTGFLNLLMGHDIAIVFRSFYNKSSAQAGKEESLLNSRAFLALFILFGLTSGLFIYQVSAAYDKFYSITGFQLFVSLSVLIVILFALKLLVLRFIGFVFDVNKIVSEYVSILYLTYFNIAFIFLPLTLCFCLLPKQFTQIILIAALVLIIVVFVWQYLRSSVNIISNFRFHKFYLFIYLCALEICPVLILIKALNI
jgi:hypothetical protein